MFTNNVEDRRQIFMEIIYALYSNVSNKMVPSKQKKYMYYMNDYSVGCDIHITKKSLNGHIKIKKFIDPKSSKIIIN